MDSHPVLPVEEGLPPLGHVLEYEPGAGPVEGEPAGTTAILNVKTETKNYTLIL